MARYVTTTSSLQPPYAVTLTTNWMAVPVNPILSKVFNKTGDTTTRGLRKALA